MNLPLGKYSSFSQNSPSLKKYLTRMHIDVPLALLLIAILSVSLIVLYSATEQNIQRTLMQLGHICFGFFLMWLIAMVPPDTLKRWTPKLFLFFLIPLLLVLAFGVKVKGAARWLDLGFFRFLPSEVYKILVPMMMAWLLSEARLPIRFGYVILGLLVIAIPVGLIAKQPDLGTSLVIGMSGLVAMFLAGLKWRVIAIAVAIIVGGGYAAWKFDVIEKYQKERVEAHFKILFGDEKSIDAKDSNYQSQQSAIAIGSGGRFGKGYLNGTQTNLGFLPEKHTDFIYAVVSEEFGLVGALVVLLLFILILFRGLIIATSAQSTYARLLAGTLIFMFVINACINILMVQSLLPVVGLPLPLLSYGGTSVVSLLAGFGMLMSIQTHRKLI